MLVHLSELNFMKIKIILCEDLSQINYYMRQFITRPGNEKCRYSFDVKEILKEDDRIIFLTPNHENKIRGMEIDSYEEHGTPYKHKNYKYFIDFLKASTRR